MTIIGGHFRFKVGTDDEVKIWAIPGLFLFIFGLFQVNIKIFITNQCEKIHPV